MVKYQTVEEDKPKSKPSKPKRSYTNWKKKYKNLKEKYKDLQTKNTELQESFWLAWEDLIPSCESVFKKSKWPSKFTSLMIVKKEIEKLRGDKK